MNDATIDYHSFNYVDGLREPEHSIPPHALRDAVRQAWIDGAKFMRSAFEDAEKAQHNAAAAVEGS